MLLHRNPVREDIVSTTKVMRVPADVHSEAVQIAALRHQQPAALIAEAWRDYFEKNRAEFAADLERAAEILRNGTTEDLASFASRNAEARGAASAARLRGGPSEGA